MAAEGGSRSVVTASWTVDTQACRDRDSRARAVRIATGVANAAGKRALLILRRSVSIVRFSSRRLFAVELYSWVVLGDSHAVFRFKRGHSQLFVTIPVKRKTRNSQVVRLLNQLDSHLDPFALCFCRGI